LCTKLPTPQEAVPLAEDESAHLQQALRIRPGDTVIAMDGRGTEIEATALIRDKKLWLQTEHTQPSRKVASEAETSPFVLEMAIIKGDSMSWVIEKAVELGVQRIIPIECDHGVVEVSKKGVEHFVERWQRIADQALKQCERLNRLKVEPPIPFGQALASKAKRFIAVEPGAGFADVKSLPLTIRGALSPLESLHVMIGPEGGWSAAECDAMRAEFQSNRAVPVNLGRLVLRAETAAIFAMSSVLSARIS
jgi:16S rRNA (uracil1498-N3)-methyltransferase